jgi:hypothetical protein
MNEHNVLTLPRDRLQRMNDLAGRGAPVELARLQLENEEALRVRLAEFGKMLIALDEQNRRLQKIIESRLTITAAQARGLRRMVIDRAALLCAENGLEYAEYGRRFRDAMTNDAKRAFMVAAVGDIPAVMLDSAREFVASWSSYRLARELRMKKSAEAKARYEQA